VQIAKYHNNPVRCKNIIQAANELQMISAKNKKRIVINFHNARNMFNEFKKYIIDSIKDKTMDGKKLANEISGNGILNKIKGMKTNIEKENAKLDEVKGHKPTAVESKIPRTPLMGK